MNDDRAWSELWAEAKAADILEVARRLGAKLRRSGPNWTGPCPAGCADDDGFIVTPSKHLFLCRPSGATGDAVDMVMHARGGAKAEALTFVTGRDPPRRSSPAGFAETAPRPVDDDDPGPAAPASQPDKRQRDDEAVGAIIHRAAALGGTQGEAYFRARGLNPPHRLVGDLKFVPDLEYWSGGRVVETLPAVIAVIRDVGGAPIGVHRTYLDPHAAPPEKWAEGRLAAKKIRGRAKGGLIRLGLIGDKLAVGEGVETTLAWHAFGFGPEDVTLASCIALGLMASMVLPADVRELILLGDGDSDPVATATAIRAAGERFQAEGLTVSVHPAPAGMDWNDVLNRQGEVEIPPILSFDLYKAATEHLFKKPFVSKYGALFLDQLDDPGPEFEWLIDGWISLGDRSVIGGKSQSGKSFLAAHAALCIAHGLDFFGASVTPGLVIYQAGEGARGFKRRLRAWRRHFGVTFSRETPFVLLQEPVDLWRPDTDTPKLIEEIKGIAAQFSVPLRLVVFDTLAMATVGADEISGRDMGLVMANVAKIGAGTGGAVCLVHHLNAEGARLRGHTSIFANIDQVILVDEDLATKVRTVTLDKIRDGGERGGSFAFELMWIDLGEVERDGKPVGSCVCLPVGEKEAVRRDQALRGFKLDDDEVLFMAAYFEAETRFGEPVPADLDLPAAVRSIVSYDAVKRAFRDKSPSDAVPAAAADDDDEEAKAKAAERHRAALKKRLQRLRERLTRLGVIGASTGRIWWTGKALRAFPETVPKVTEADEGIPF